MRRARYDLILVGTGFSTSFFLQRWLGRSPKNVRVLVLERGEVRSHAWQLAGDYGAVLAGSQESIRNVTPEKQWIFTNAFGGGSNCWFACTPRMLPDDFRIRSKFGIGVDWPVSYEELEPYYCDAEELLAVAGPPNEDSPFPRSRPYPQPPHRFNAVDAMFKRAYPDRLFVQPAARPTLNTERRPACCGNTSCFLCPIDSKFTVLNELSDLYADPRVTLLLGARATAVDIVGGTRAGGVRWVQGGREEAADADLVVLGANAIFNPHILLSSGLAHPELGRGLGEQVGTEVILHLEGVDNYGGSTWVGGHWYGLHTDDDRRHRAAALVEIGNEPKLRDERGKWRRIAVLRVIFENLRQRANTVTVDSANPAVPVVSHPTHSDYTQRGLDGLERRMEELLRPFPVEEMFIRPKPMDSEAHIMGTTVMGNDPATSVIDRNMIHHTVRNLLVLGGGAFPTFAPANPTLTLSALALRAADSVTGAPKGLA